MSKKRWVAYGVTGIVGLSVVAGGAVATASAMELQTTDGSVVPGGAVTNRADVLDAPVLRLQETSTSVTVVTGPTTATVPSALTPPAPVPAPSPVTPPAPSPVTPPAPASPASAVSPASAASAGSD